MTSRMEADLIAVFDTRFLQHPFIGTSGFTNGLALTSNMLAREYIGITGYSGELLQNIDSQRTQINDRLLPFLVRGTNNVLSSQFTCSHLASNTSDFLAPVR